MIPISDAARHLRSLFGRKLAIAALGLAVCCARSRAQWTPAQDQAYRNKFNTQYPPLAVPYTSVEQYNTGAPISRFLGATLNSYINQLKNGTYPSYAFHAWLEGFNIAYQVTHEIQYFRANLRLLRELIAYRDDKRGVPLRTGEIVPGWGSDAYSAGNGRECYVVDSGQLLYPMFDTLRLAQSDPVLLAEFNQGSNEFETLKFELVLALEYHDFEYRNGPGADEGHYVFTPRNYNEFYNLSLQYTPQPGNWYSAMGRALWAAWKVTGNTGYRDRALHIGRYIQRRLKNGTDGAYYWEYYLPVNPVSPLPVAKQNLSPEDISHGGLTMSLPLELALDGEVFTSEEMRKLCRTVRLGFGRLGDGVIVSVLNGNPAAAASPAHAVAYWVRLTPYDRAVFPLLSQFFLRYWASPGPLDNAVLLEGIQNLANSTERSWFLYQ